MLLFDDLRFDDHDTGPMHPERAARLSAVREGLSAFNWERRPAQPADAAALRLVHTPAHVQRILSAEGRSVAVDADTLISPGSVLAARLAARLSARLSARRQRRAFGDGCAERNVRQIPSRGPRI